MTELKEDSQFDFLYKILLIGDSNVGKTCLIQRFTKDLFQIDQQPTIGVEFSTKTTRISDKIIKAQIWDTAGQERYRAITSAYYRGAMGAMLVFDISKKGSFENLQKWLKELKEHSDLQIIPMLIGNKNDLADKRQVTVEDASKFAEENDMPYLETSAMQSTNVEKAFQQLIQCKKEQIWEDIQENNIFDQSNQGAPQQKGSAYKIGKKFSSKSQNIGQNGNTNGSSNGSDKSSCC